MLGQVALAGFSAVVLWNLLETVLSSAFGLLLGALALLFKVALMVMIGYAVLSLFKRGRKERDDD